VSKVYLVECRLWYYSTRYVRRYRFYSTIDENDAVVAQRLANVVVEVEALLSRYIISSMGVTSVVGAVLEGGSQTLVYSRPVAIVGLETGLLGNDGAGLPVRLYLSNARVSAFRIRGFSFSFTNGGFLAPETQQQVRQCFVPLLSPVTGVGGEARWCVVRGSAVYMVQDVVVSERLRGYTSELDVI